MRAFEDMCPSVILIYYLSVAGIVMFSQNPIFVATALLGCELYYLISRRNRGGRAFSLVLFSILTIINPIMSHNGRTVLLVINDMPITLEALIYGAVSAGTVVAVIGLFGAFSEIMTRDKLLYVFGKLSPRSALVLSMGLRYVNLLTERAKAIKDSQRALGAYTGDNIYSKFKSDLRVFSVLVTWALENGITTADSMTARAYGSTRRTFYSRFRFTLHDAIFLCVTLVCFCVAMCAVALGAAGFEYYPSFAIADVTPLTIIAYIAYGIIAVLPAALELRERIKWKYLLSKI